MRIDNMNTTSSSYKKTAVCDKKHNQTEIPSDAKLQKPEESPEAAVLLAIDTSRTPDVQEPKDPSEYYRKLSEELKKAQEQSDAAGDAFKELILCLRIAMRIISGNKVPIEDQRYLMEKNPELYGKAMMMRVQKRDPEEYDRLTEDEDRKDVGSPESQEAQQLSTEPQAQSGADNNDPAAAAEVESL